MNKVKEIYDTVVGSGMDFGTGVWTAISPKIQNKMNRYGEFEPYIAPEDFNSFTKEEVNKIAATTIGWKNTKTIDDISEELFSNIEGINFNKDLGYYLGLYAGYVSEESYRDNATSGGFGSWILKELLEQDIVDGVLNVVKNDDKSSNLLFKYSVSNTVEDIFNGAKTKYYPVELSEVLQYVKNNEGRYAIIGVPSFIYSIRLLAEQDEIINKRILYTVGLICGHQKSSNYLTSLVDQVGINYDALTNVDFRKKVQTENADEYIIEFTYIDNGIEKKITKKMRDLLGYSWGQGHFKIRASDFTDDVMNETADITLGDAWIPPYKFDGRGNNVLIIRNPIIHDLILTAIDDGRLNLDELTEEETYATQPGHFRHTVDELPYRVQKYMKEDKWFPETRIDEKAKVPYLRKKVQNVREEIRDTSRNEYVKYKEKNDFEGYLTKMNKLEKKYNSVYSLIEIKRLGLKGSFSKAKKRYFD